jgi:hypothetical protein
LRSVSRFSRASLAASLRFSRFAFVRSTNAAKAQPAPTEIAVRKTDMSRFSVVVGWRPRAESTPRAMKPTVASTSNEAQTTIQWSAHHRPRSLPQLSILQLDADRLGTVDRVGRLRVSRRAVANTENPAGVRRLGAFWRRTGPVPESNGKRLLRT